MISRSCITIFVENNEPQIYDLDSFDKEYVRLGRGPFHGDSGSEKNDIAIPADISIISRAHCTFHKTGEGWYIHDDQSLNGLIFNGMKISSQQLHDGDKFYIGTEINARCVIAFSYHNSINAGKNAIEKIALEGRNRYVLGRDADCDIVLKHPSVSRHHCVITYEDGSYYINDNSMNGIILNSSPLKKKQKLQQMDKITIADTSMIFCDHQLYFTKNAGGVSVVAKEVVKEVKAGKGKKRITNNVSLSIEPGEFVAIIGGSGAGKTTLLNCLSGMADFTSGDILINGESIKTNNRSIRSIIGYVPQSDIVYDNLTLERMLFYSAQLRMPRDTSKDEIKQKINETLEMVELSEHRNTVISRLSGGQKKRASIAVELLASPKLFFLDEPSSGLDPGTEKNLMAMLKKLTLTGKTVIMVTHTVQNIGMCDRVICMGNGGLLCYSGKPLRALAFFEKESMTDIYEDLNEHSANVSEKFRRATYGRYDVSPSTQPEREKRRHNIIDSLLQFKVMMKRYAEIIWKSKPRLLLLLFMPVLLTALVCIAFQADGNLYNYMKLSVNRTNLPFLVGSDTMTLMFTFSCAVFWVGIFNSVQEISKERTIYERERFTGVKTVPYIMSKFVIIGILCIVQSLIMMLLFTFFTNTTATVDGDMTAVTALKLSMGKNGIVFTNGGLWFELYITTFLLMLSAMCLGLTISAAVSNDMALVLCPVCLLPQILFSGVPSTLSGITETMSNIVSCRWSCIAYFTSTGINNMYQSCTYDMGSWVKTEFGNGFGIDEAYSAYKTYLFGLNPVWSSWLILLILSVVCIALSILLLYIKRTKK